MRFQAKINKILDQYFIAEGQNEDRALALLKKAGKESFYNSLLDITSDKNNKNKHLPILVKFFLEGQSIDIIKNYYERFISNTKLNQKPIDNLTFQQFEQMVDSAVVSTNVKSKTLDDKTLYEDENVKIYLGDTKEKCIKYGQGSKYGFCIARSDASNLYWGYRSRGATFYFVYFKNKIAQAKAPSDLIVIHAYPDDKYYVNYAIPNADHQKSKKDIVNEFHALDGLIGKVIVFREHSEKEQEVLKVKDARSITSLNKLEERLIYLELGNPIEDYEWPKLKESGESAFSEVLKKYLEVGFNDIPEDVIKGTKFENRYWNKVKQRMEIKVERLKAKFAEYNEEDDNQVPVAEYFMGLTNDEFITFLKDHKEAYTPEKLKSSLSRMVEFPKKMKAFKKVFEMFDLSYHELRIVVIHAIKSRMTNSAALNFLCNEKGVDLGDEYTVNIYDLLEFTSYKVEPEISHKALSQLLDSFKHWMIQSGGNKDDLQSGVGKELFLSNLDRLEYKDLKQKYLSIFQETK